MIYALLLLTPFVAIYSLFEGPTLTINFRWGTKINLYSRASIPILRSSILNLQSLVLNHHCFLYFLEARWWSLHLYISTWDSLSMFVSQWKWHRDNFRLRCLSEAKMRKWESNLSDQPFLSLQCLGVSARRSSNRANLGSDEILWFFRLFRMDKTRLTPEKYQFWQKYQIWQKFLWIWCISWIWWFCWIWWI